jgi:predicted ArsR family transcriptional regulator
MTRLIDPWRPSRGRRHYITAAGWTRALVLMIMLENRAPMTVHALSAMLGTHADAVKIALADLELSRLVSKTPLPFRAGSKRGGFEWSASERARLGEQAR